MAITITWTDVVNIAPELAAIPLASQTALLADVVLVLSPEVWGAKLNMGAKYWVAHTATMNRRRGAGGAVQSQAVGGVSRAFAVAPVIGEYNSTSYGTIFESLLMSLAAARFAVA